MALNKKFKEVLSLNFGKEDEIHVGLLTPEEEGSVFTAGTITLDEIDEFLDEYKEDYNVYMCYAPIDGDSRTLDNAKPTRFLVADIDGAEIPEKFPPSYYWETSPNKCQGLWISDKVISPKDYAVLAHAMVKEFNFDSASDLVHLYRIPTSINHKYATPQKISKPIGDGMVYRRQDIYELLNYTKYKDRVNVDKKSTKGKKIPNKEYNLKELYKRYTVKALVEREIEDRSSYVYAIAKAMYEQGAKSSEVKYLILNHTEQDKWDKRTIDPILLSIKSKTKKRKNKKVSESVNISEDDIHIIGLSDIKEGEHGEEWLIEGLWEYDSVGLLVAPPKSYKSTLITNMAVAIASGKPLSGRRVQQGGVLILQGENSLIAEKSRMQSIAGTTDLPIYYVQNNITLDNIELLKRTIIQHGIKLLVIDPLYLLFGSGNMNHQVDVTPKLKALTDLRKETECSIIVVHHTRKVEGNSDISTADINGSGFFEGWYESLIMLQPPRTTRVRKVKMFNRFRNHIGSEGIIRIHDTLQMDINLDDDYGMAYTEETNSKPVNNRKERLEKKKAKRSKTQENTVEYSKNTVEREEKKKAPKKPIEYTYTTKHEVFFKDTMGEVHHYPEGCTIDLTGVSKISVDIETTGLIRQADDIKSIQITADESENTYVIWVDGNYTELRSIVEFLNQFKVITHNGKFDSLFFYEKSGLELKLWGDTQILAHLMTEPSLKLKALVEKYFGVEYDIEIETKKSNAKITVASVKKQFKEWSQANTELTKLTAYNKVINQLHTDLDGKLYVENWGQFLEFVDNNTEYDKVLDFYSKVSKRTQDKKRYELIEYGMNDTIFTIRLFNLLREKVKAYKLSKVYKHELRCYKAYIEVEKQGVTIDLATMNEVKEELQQTINKLSEELFSNEDVKEQGIENFGSPKQLKEFFVDYLGLKPTKVTDKGSPKIDTAQLVEWDKKKKHEIIPTLLDWKKATKQLQFIVSWEDLSQYDGKIHPSFNITAETGRTTCSSPNLQQVPQASILRNVITAPKGRKVIEVDMSQAELRVASMFAKDENMMGAYLAGSDLHTATMNFLYAGKTPKDDQQAKAWRTDAKATNFGFLYGMTAKTFVDYAKGYGLELTVEEAEDFREGFFESYPRLLDYHDDMVEYARKHGYTYSPIGRKRFLPDINSTNWKKASESERQAINTPVQGFASDMVISAMADIVADKSMDKTKYKIMGTIHDAILVEVDEDIVEEYAQKIKEHMENPSVLEICEMELTVPMVADIEIGSAWGLHD